MNLKLLAAAILLCGVGLAGLAFFGPSANAPLAETPKGEAATVDHVKADPLVEPTKADPVKTDPVKADPPKIDPLKWVDAEATVLRITPSTDTNWLGSLAIGDGPDNQVENVIRIFAPGADPAETRLTKIANGKVVPTKLEDFTVGCRVQVQLMKKGNWLHTRPSQGNAAEVRIVTPAAVAKKLHLRGSIAKANDLQATAKPGGNVFTLVVDGEKAADCKLEGKVVVHLNQQAKLVKAARWKDEKAELADLKQGVRVEIEFDGDDVTKTDPPQAQAMLVRLLPTAEKAHLRGVVKEAKIVGQEGWIFPPDAVYGTITLDGEFLDGSERYGPFTVTVLDNVTVNGEYLPPWSLKAGQLVEVVFGGKVEPKEGQSTVTAKSIRILPADKVSLRGVVKTVEVAPVPAGPIPPGFVFATITVEGQKLAGVEYSGVHKITVRNVVTDVSAHVLKPPAANVVEPRGLKVGMTVEVLFGGSKVTKGDPPSVAAKSIRILHADKVSLRGVVKTVEFPPGNPLAGPPGPHHLFATITVEGEKVEGVEHSGLFQVAVTYGALDASGRTFDRSGFLRPGVLVEVVFGESKVTKGDPPSVAAKSIWVLQGEEKK